MMAVGVTFGGTIWTGGAGMAGDVYSGGQSDELIVGTVWCVILLVSDG